MTQATIGFFMKCMVGFTSQIVKMEAFGFTTVLWVGFGLALSIMEPQAEKTSFTRVPSSLGFTTAQTKMENGGFTIIPVVAGHLVRGNPSTQSPRLFHQLRAERFMAQAPTRWATLPDSPQAQATVTDSRVGVEMRRATLRTLV